MSATALATIAALKVILFRKTSVAFIRYIVIAFFKWNSFVVHILISFYNVLQK